MPDEFIDPHQFLKQLPPDKLGQYEPVSGIMLVNITSAELNEIAGRYAAGQCTDADIEILRAINHETYHFAQTVACGYMYLRQHQLFCLVRDAKVPQFTEPEYGDSERINAVLSLMAEQERLSILRQRAAPGEVSLAGAIMPELFAQEKKLAAMESETNAAGLSIKALVEGSAVINAEKVIGGGACTRAALEAQLQMVPPAYRVLFDLTAERYGDWAPDLILPATALALRYAQPHEAYFELVEAIADNPGDPIGRGRALAASLPAIPAAGAILGTAVDAHEPTEQFSVYRGMLQDLAAGAWGMDSYELLSDPSAMLRMARFPIGLALKDGYTGLPDRTELVARLEIMSIVLRVRSLAREQRDYEKALVGWLDSLGRRWGFIG
jgi:phage protein U